LSKNHDIYKLLDEHVRNDEVAARAKSSIKELYFLAAEIEDYVYWQTRVLRKMLDNGITLNDIGEYTQAMRILTDRKNIANPEGKLSRMPGELWINSGEIWARKDLMTW